jgi:hypothetical protein
VATSVSVNEWVEDKVRNKEESHECLQEGALQEPRPVLDGHYDVSAVDVIEVVLGGKPGALEVVDGEFNVGWDPEWLDWT